MFRTVSWIVLCVVLLDWANLLLIGGSYELVGEPRCLPGLLSVALNFRMQGHQSRGPLGSDRMVVDGTLLKAWVSNSAECPNA